MTKQTQAGANLRTQIGALNRIVLMLPVLPALALPALVLPVLVLSTLMMSGHPSLAADGPLKPYKDRIFKYRKPLQSEDGGGFRVIPYDPKKDINARDKIPVRKVHGMYVSLKPRRYEQDLTIEANGRKVTYFAVGKLKGNAKYTAIFLHGRDGTRHLGFDDDRFGGNFNRAKNLAVRNGGIYISADFSEYQEGKKIDDGKMENARQDVEAIVKRYRTLTNGPMILVCGSMGSFICWKMINNPKSAAMVDGLFVMGGFPNPTFLESGKISPGVAGKPIYLAHGEIDYVYKWQGMKRYYDALKQKGNPVRYVVFKGGKHGTPVRMADWREALNFIISNSK